MSLRSFFSDYGLKVEGYDTRVINEREARAAAGLLFIFGFLSLYNCVVLEHLLFVKMYITFFLIDFIIRVINTNYSPSLLLGRFFVKNQKPEYVGAAQKRFAWGLGLVLALVMFNIFVVDYVATYAKVFICFLCLFLLISESAFGICYGCKIYEFILNKKASHCPGGVCEITKKDPVQMFNPVQMFIATSTAIFIVVGAYNFTVYTENRTLFGEFISESVMTQSQIEAKKNAEFKKEMEQEF